MKLAAMASASILIFPGNDSIMFKRIYEIYAESPKRIQSLIFMAFYRSATVFASYFSTTYSSNIFNVYSQNLR